ncbi:PKD domain-containing protein [Patulibacter minatonensis]|uniref:PKD domain-containing protein n=1 Tax=Patulibacter minatonensis TaxID=298163 RepID=UPI00047A0184|nr:PKD domain-containing protein [Patulibacter minatonensis]
MNRPSNIPAVPPSRRTRPRTAPVAAALAASALAVVPATASAAWQEVPDAPAAAAQQTAETPPRTFSPDWIERRALTFSPAGEIGWTSTSFTSGGNVGFYGRRAGGAWDATPTARADASSLTPVYGIHGEAALLRQEYDYNGHGAPAVATRTAKGAWTAFSPIPGAPADSDRTQLVIDRDGALVASWRGAEQVGTGIPIFVATRPKGGSWTAPRQVGSIDLGDLKLGTVDGITLAPDELGTRMSTSADGTVVVAWGDRATDPEVGKDPALQNDYRRLRGSAMTVARRSPDGSWSGPLTVRATPRPVGDFTVVTDDAGGATVRFYSYDGTTVARLPKDASAFQPAHDLPLLTSDSARTGGLSQSQLSTASIGDGQTLVTGLWSAKDEGAPVDDYGRYPTRLVAFGTTDGETWTRQVVNTGANYSNDAGSLAVNRAQGVITIGYTDGALLYSPSYLKDVALRARDWYPWDGSLSQRYDVPGGREFSTMQIDARGDTIFDDSRSPVPANPSVFIGGSPRHLYFNGLKGPIVDDASGPDVTSLKTPATLKVKATGTFRVQATDAFSALGTTTWDFGDGTTGTGPSVTHRFAKAGTYVVSATVSDEHGNPTATSSTVRVGTATSTPVKAGARVSRGVSISDVRLAGRRLSVRASGAAHLLVTVQRQVTGRAHGRTVTGLLPGRVIRLQPQQAGAVVAKVPHLKPGSYRVRVREDAGGPARVITKGTTVRVGR